MASKKGTPAYANKLEKNRARARANYWKSREKEIYYPEMLKTPRKPLDIKPFRLRKRRFPMHYQQLKSLP